ncbi:hypothetical protein CK203_019925 [Vitis vinifera]|uniref:TFIIS N-terminal domain-containing protein n=1 Tax=Vitis vinifera TaxID=29760 RepID=A0A438J350_VITVI|nr:hypothetical protein CK203_019925 [Vitis vinifera]
MTLEDFFTLTEMKDGLTAPARVEELVTVMQKEKDCVVKNVGDATRQWSTVASTIAATENQDCLDLFIQLDGLWFINRWLKDAQKFGNDPSDSFVEESITALLRALEKLHIDNEKLISSGIGITVKNLLGHDSSRIQDRARALFDSWKQSKDCDAVHQDVEKVGAFCDDGIIGSAKPTGESGLPECSAMDTSLSKENQSETVQIQTSNNQVNTDITLDHPDMEVESADPPPHSVMLNPVQENNLSMKEESPLCPSEGTTTIKTSSSIPAEGNFEGNSGVPKVNEFTDDEKQMHERNSSPDHLGKEFSPTSTTLEPRAVSSSGATATAGKPVVEPASQNVADAKAGDFSEKSKTLGSEPESGKDDIGVLSHCKSTLVFKTTETSFSRMEDIGGINEDQGHASDGCDDVANASDFSRLAMEGKGSDMIDKKSDIELEYGMVDPLELARRVAKEVERQVGDFREPFCSSSSEKISEGGIRVPDSPDSINGKQHQPMDGPPTEVPAGQITPVDALLKEEEHLNSQNLDVEPENCIPDVESSLKSSLRIWIAPVNPISTPVAVVSASRATAAPGLPGAPLQFEGTRGWKGSAATSAFRPASPRRIPDAGKTLLTGETSNSSKQKQQFDFDLNVVEGGDDDLMFPASSGFPSGESSVEVSPKRSDRLKLDLNRVSNEGDAPLSDWKMEGPTVHYRNGHRSPSPAFSSSSSMQSSMRNIDLNDRPSLQNNSSDLQPNPGGLKQDEPVISLLGTRVGVNRKTVMPQTPSYQPNGKAPETVDANLGRTGGILGMGPPGSYPHSHVLGYNGLTTGAPMSFSSPMYVPGGSIPYMVDSRGAPVVPQIMGSASTVAPSYSQSPFLMTMSGVPSGINGAGLSRPNFDLNSGFIVDGGNRDTGVSRQLFIPGQSEQLRGNLQPSSSSGLGGKRKEPDGGWESYPFNFKLHQPPWK